MFERELKEFRSLVRKSQILLTIHALDEMGEDDVLEEDIENVIIMGRIIERQLDRVTGERKFVLSGVDLAGAPVGVVLKTSPAGKVVVITVYREEE